MNGYAYRTAYSVLALATMAMVAACSSSPATAGGAQSAANEPSSSEPAETESASTEAPATPETTEEGKADEPKATGDSSPEDVSPSGEDAQRKVLYKVTPKGLVIEVDGVKFEPAAKAIRKKGGWGVKVSVKATSTDGRMHRLLSPENGPLAFAATVQKKEGEVLATGDERKGEDEAFVPPDDSTDFSREFPGAKEAALSAGQTLELQVGLWGLAAEAERRRPLRKLFVVKMVTGKTAPQPVITPPE